MEDWLEAQGLGAGMVLVDTQEETLAAVVEGNADCTIAMRLLALHLREGRNWTQLVLGREPFLTLDYCYAVRKDRQELLAQFREGLALVTADGTHRRIHDRWFGRLEREDLVTPLLRRIALVVAPLLLVGLLAVLWSWSLRRQVAEKTRALRASEKQYRQLFANMTAGFAVHEMIYDETGTAVDYRFLEVNPAFERLTGLRAADIVGRTLLETMPASERRWIGIYAPVAATMQPLAFQEHSAALGRHFDLYAFAPQPGRFAVVFIDITERKHAEAALRASEQSLRATFAAIADGIISTDDAGRVVRMNPVAERLTGWSLGEAAGRPLAEIYRPLDPGSREPLPDQVPASGSGAAHADNAILVARDGSERRIAGRVSPIRSPEDRDLGAVLVIRDTSEQHALEERLRQSHKMDAIGQLAGGIAHDFNNMLGGIMAAAELLAKRLGADARAATYLRIIDDSSQRAAELTRNLLAFARRQPAGSTPIEVHEAVQAAVELLRSTIDRRISIALHLEAAASRVVGDAAQLQSVFLNLGINACHAMPDGGTLTFATRVVQLDQAWCAAVGGDIAPGDHVEIEVRDTGTGIPPDRLPRLFEPFYTTKPKGQGTGLGLPSALGTIQQHRGAITVYSEVGVGTVFRIVLPLAQAALSPPQAEQQPVRGTGVVLLVDDEPVMRTCGTGILEEAGYTVLTAVNGAAAVDIFRQRSAEIDLVVLDMIMPVMNGRDCFHALRRFRPDARIILASGFSQEHDVHELRQHGLAGFIRKPYRGWELTRIAAEALGRN